jgi:hypothetical protein
MIIHFRKRCATGWLIGRRSRQIFLCQISTSCAGRFDRIKMPKFGEIKPDNILPFLCVEFFHFLEEKYIVLE